MLKIRALNRESSSDEDFPVIRREAQEEIALEEYNNALRLQATGKYLEAEKILLGLVEENIPQLENNGGLPHSMSTIKYSCYVNIGSVYVKKGEPEKALDYYLKASELDTTDVTLWYKIGTLAAEQNRFGQAIHSFAQGLVCSESHWPCLDQLISLLYATRDTISCLLYIGKALSLDPNYTKGLVLRKHIYKNNPATLEYYQKFNPDYIWEPSSDVSIDEEDEVEILEKEDKLFARITAVEKALGPKPLQTIPLPKPLEEFTWISLAQVITHLHQYITDNDMSHFCLVDLSKCMSQLLDKESVEIENAPVENDQIASESRLEPIRTEDEDKMEVETELQRRPSQNSENNNEGQEQTDNDEEQPMEQDGDDADENDSSKTDKNRSLNKSSSSNKRKRDLLSDLQIWGWHSKRKSGKKGKTDKDLTVEDALNRIIPSNLLKNKVGDEKFNQFEDSMNTMDIYNMYVEEENHLNILSPIHSPQSTIEEYFGTNREKEDVMNLWKKERDYCDAVLLIRDLVFGLAKLWNIKWPKELIALYIKAYDMFREHFDIPNAFSRSTPFEEMEGDALATLLYGELVTFSTPKSENKNIHVTLLAFLQMMSSWQDEWKDEFSSFFVRVFWLKSHIFRKEGDNTLAIQSLELVEEAIDDLEVKFLLTLPNCLKCGVVSKEIVSKILKHLDMVTSLNCLEDLYNAEKYRQVIDILKLTFANNRNPTWAKMGRPAQLAMLMHSTWYTDFSDCFIWTEECLHEALGHYLKPTKHEDKWEKLLEKCLLFFYEIIKTEGVAISDSLSEERRGRLVESLVKIVRKQLNTENTCKIPQFCVTPWILLHFLLVREEHKQQAKNRISHVKNDKESDSYKEFLENRGDDLPPSVAILFSAHEFLGPKGWCLANSGELLHFMLDTVLDRLDTPIFEPLREKIDIHIEQALFCLYQHPSKKNKVSRHLADHNVDPLQLTWARSSQLYDFYGPDCLPEFNSYKNASVSSDCLELLQRIIALVPQDVNPQPHIPKICDFIQGKSAELPSVIAFSNKLRSIYYLIGDYYFKQREFGRCLKYFQMDLCINPTRVDTWACIALSYLSQLENKLNYCKRLKTETEFLDTAKCAQTSFKKALELAEDHIMLWIEFGSFEYMVHSFCSRLMKTDSDTLSMEKFELLENQKNDYLESSGRSFEKAIELYQPDEIEQDERWLQYYILGKVAEKKQKEPDDFLKLYEAADKLLHENSAEYPDKINYHNPQHLSVEALELRYRVNASILKYLELHEGKNIPNSVGVLFKKYLDNSYFPEKNLVKESYLPTVAAVNPITTPAEAIKTKKSDKSKSNLDDLIVKDVKKCLGDILEKVVKNQEKSADDVKSDRDVIMISDSDDEGKPPTEEEKKLAAVVEKSNVLELFDKMMEETMKKTEDQEADSDTSVASKTVIENKPESAKTEAKMKSGSETDDIRTSVDETSSSPTSSSSSSSSSESDSDDDSSESSTTSSSETVTGNMSHSDTLALVDRCIVGLEQCVIRLPQNYKALYRLAHLYFNYKSRRDFGKCKQLLLGEYTCKGGITITGLFSDRKNHNFFHGIYRIPSSEIDRPGSLSAHMSRCITLLLQVLRATNDSKTLLDLSMQFKKIPDPDKIYIKDSERMQFADQAMTLCTQSLKSQIQNIQNLNEHAVQKLLQDIFKSYQRVQKHEPSKESLFSGMLTEAYRKWRKEIGENVNVLDVATKFCQQYRGKVDKPKRAPPPTPPPPMMRGPGTLQAPVLPTPSTIQPQIQPLKRPGMGRPRGRPPLPKVPGQVKSGRGRGSNSNARGFPWSPKSVYDQNATYNYLKHYQEELMKQYSQSLSLSQLTQLSQYLTQNPFNPLAQAHYGNSQVMNPMMTNPNLFVNNNLVTKAPRAKKKQQVTVTRAPPSLSVEAVKQFTNLQGSSSSVVGKPTTGYGKKNLPHTVTSSSQSGVGAPPGGHFMNLPQMAHSASSSGSVKSGKGLSHSIASITQQVPTKPAGLYSNPMDFMKNLGSKVAPSTASTKTTASYIFKEPSLSKAYKPSADRAANILMKERPNISITPVLPASIPLMSTPSFMPPSMSMPSSSVTSGKTLQEKLADKQKQQATKHLTRHIEAEIIKKDLNTMAKQKQDFPNIPASLSVSKAAIKFPLESGISISQIPVNKPAYHKDVPKRKEKPAGKTNFPVSLSVVKKPSSQRRDDDDVIVIE